MGEPDCCLSCKTAASATIGNRPLRIRTVGGVVGRREYPHASYPIKLAAMNWGDGITVDARRASVSPAMPCTEKTRELVELINEAARLEGFEAGWVDAGGGSDANRIAQAGTPVVDGVAPAGGCFHSEREYLRVDTIENRVRMLSRFVTLLEKRTGQNKSRGDRPQTVVLRMQFARLSNERRAILRSGTVNAVVSHK